MINSKRYFTSSVILLNCIMSGAAFTQTLPPLEICNAYHQILANTYELKAADAEINAKEADRWQAGAYPNPALSINLNTIGRDQDGDENELFVGVTQIVELGGKRSARLRVAGTSQCSTQWDLEIAKAELFSKLTHAFIDMAVAQEREALAKGQQIIAEQTLKAICGKANTGCASGIEEKKAQVAFRSATLLYRKQSSNLQKAKKQLISIWDCNPPAFDTVNFPLYQLVCPPPLSTLVEALKCSPEINKAQTESALAGAVVSLEQSKRIPDIALTVGVITQRFVKEPALCVGFGIPLPLFDQNEGNISRASYEQLQAMYDQLDLENQLRNALEITYDELTSAYEQATALKESILPSADAAFQLAQSGYNEGKFDYLTLLDARSTLFNMQQEYLDTIEEYHHKRAEVLKLTATYPLYEN